MMANHGMFPYYQDTTLQAIALPYAGGKFSMVVLLPAAGADFAAFQQGLSPQTWNAVIGKLARQQGSIALPRFTVSYSASLNQALSALGMGIAFGPRADLGDIFADVQAGISAVLHKAVMKVYEAGTTAAAVTAVIGATLAMPTQFTMQVDRPFFCAIRDNVTGTLLFMGAIVDPR
jgi:serpin B